MENNTIPKLPKATFTDRDHSKIRMVMSFHDPMKEMLNELWGLYFDGLNLKDERHVRMRDKLQRLVDNLNRF